MRATVRMLGIAAAVAAAGGAIMAVTPAGAAEAAEAGRLMSVSAEAKVTPTANDGTSARRCTASTRTARWATAARPATVDWVSHCGRHNRVEMHLTGTVLPDGSLRVTGTTETGKGTRAVERPVHLVVPAGATAPVTANDRSGGSYVMRVSNLPG